MRKSSASKSGKAAEGVCNTGGGGQGPVRTGLELPGGAGANPGPRLRRRARAPLSLHTPPGREWEPA